MPESDEHKHYAAYLVRLWKEKGTEHDQWRASVEDPRTGERRGFANIEDLFAFLRERTASSGDATGRPET